MYFMKIINEKEPLVSIIMPAYNSEKFIKLAVESVINQIYSNWELIVVDDYSKDSTIDIINNYVSRDSRINLLRNNENSGAAVSRNKAIKESKGKYMAFLDSDDAWYIDKLKKQIEFMETNNYYFTCTDYEKIDEDGDLLNKVIKARVDSNYRQLLKKCPGNSTVIYNAMKLGKINVENIKKRNDYLMWLNIVKKENLRGMNEVLSVHRIQKNGISNNKLSLIKYHWDIYVKREKLGYLNASALILYWILKSVLPLDL